MANATLVVMAAGMGSRFGGIKQLEPVGVDGEVLLDYSVYDALRAGFDKVVFIIKHEIEKDFKEIAGDRISKFVETEYVYQTVPPYRKKPLGTGEAILLTRNVIDSPFAILNADDFYGADAFRLIRQGLDEPDYSMVTYMLFNTLSENGGVSRGVCTVEDGYLKKITETHNLDRNCGLPVDTPVSMNLWGLKPDVFGELEDGLVSFMKTADIRRDEFTIPTFIGEQVESGKHSVRALQTSAVWFGMTYREDKAQVVEKIRGLTDTGLYPASLWK